MQAHPKWKAWVMGWLWVGYGLVMGWLWVGYGLVMGWLSVVDAKTCLTLCEKWF
jgi:hypothetical protein